MSNYGESYYLEDIEEMKKENQCQECKHLNKKIELNIKNKLMNENKQLKQQLAEKEKEIEDAKDVSRRLIRICGHSNCYYKNQTAIEALEKVKEKVLQETNRVEEIYSDGLQSGFNCCYVFTREIIDQQIKKLKGEK